MELKGVPLKLDIVWKRFTAILNSSREFKFRVLVEDIIAFVFDVQREGYYPLEVYDNIEEIFSLLFWRFSLCI